MASNLKIVVAVKDPRAIVSSIKWVRKLELKGQILAMNWWCGGNKAICDYLFTNRLQSLILRYDDVCLDTVAVFADLSAFVGFDIAVDAAPNGRSHICMGNKNFINAQSKAIRHDARWLGDKTVRAIYFCHPRARRMNTKLTTGQLQIHGS